MEDGIISSVVPQEISVRIMADTYDRLETVIKPISYIKLSATPLLGRIKKMCMIDERIYIWDNVAGIVCYDMSGNLLYQMNSRGQGPSEYADINAFAVNTSSREFVIYDNAKQSLMFYSAEDGKFIRNHRLNSPVPTEISHFGGCFFYHNRFHRNYQEDASLHYYLLSSKDGIHIEQRYFKHKESEEQYSFSPSAHNLHDNFSKLYYCRDFDNIVYQVYEDSVAPRFQIELPQPLAESKVEEKPDEMSLLRSGYSLGITDVYESNSLLFFRFVKDGFIYSCLYNTKEKQQVCCAKRIKFLHSPFIDTINGVYKDCFYSILTPEYLDYALTEDSQDCPDIFKNYNPEEDNPIIAFYRPVIKK